MLFRKILSSFILLILFAAASYTTVQAITNVTISDVKASMLLVESGEMKQANKIPTKDMNLEKKQLLHSMERKTYISSGEVIIPDTLEEAIDFKQYPSKKVVATGYTAGVESTGKTESHPDYGITYSGVKVRRDLYSTIAADLNVFPLGTILYIPDYGYGVVTDIGGAIKGNKIDLYFETVAAVYEEWGKREVEVFVVEQGDGKITDADLLTLNENETLQVFREQVVGKTTRE